MIGFLIRWGSNAFVLMIVTTFVPGVYVDKWETLGLAALVLGFLNAFLRPVIVFLTLPLHIISLGFFTLIVNGCMFYAAAKIVEGFYIKSFWSAVIGALLFSIISFVLNIFIDPRGKINIHVHRGKRTPPFRDGPIIDVEGKAQDGDDGHKRLA